MTCGDFSIDRFFVKAPLAAKLKLEMLDSVGNVHLLTRDIDLCERTGQKLSGGTDERMAGAIFLIAGLLANKDDRCIRRSFTENGLRGVLPERAGAAGYGRFTQRFDRCACPLCGM